MLSPIKGGSRVQIDEILALAKQKEASDVHLSAGAPVTYRVHGDLEPMGDKLLPIDLESFARQMLSEDRWQRFMEAGEIDFSYSIPGVARFRVNAYRQRGSISIAARLIPQRIPTMEELGLPSVLKSLMNRPFGLVLVTGPTGSGKSTTLAAVLDAINHAQRKHIITLEDPIEYLHTHKLSIIDQREIGQDTSGFAPALRAALRQDPDILLVGEMRDLETIATAITASETGHLVFATLHTSDAVQTVERIIDVFPPEQQGQIRIQLAGVLAGVVSQRLHRTRDGRGRVASFEVLVNTPAVANLIRSGKTHQIGAMMQTGRQFGMVTMEMSIRELVQQGKISPAILRQWQPAQLTQQS